MTIDPLSFVAGCLVMAALAEWRLHAYAKRVRRYLDRVVESADELETLAKPLVTALHQMGDRRN